MSADRESLSAPRRYGVNRNHRFRFSVHWRSPFRSPITVVKRHRFDLDYADPIAGDGLPKSFHSSECWCHRG